jgi:site-specific DNA recombinase
MRALIYCRMSHKSDNVRVQAADCEAICEERGWTLAEPPFVDDGTSAWAGSKPRPDFLRLMEAVERGAGDILVVPNTDRLTRWAHVGLKLLDALTAHRMLVVQTDGTEYRTWTADGQRALRDQFSGAEWQSARASERLRRKHRQLLAEGRWSGGGSRRYGYEPGLTAIRDDEAAVIREAARRILAGESLGSVTADLNARGIPSSTGSIWHTHTVKAMLRGAWLSGQREYKGTLTPAIWPAILSPADTARLRAALQPGTTRAQRTLLAGILRCGWEECAHPMGTRPSGRGAAYGCPKPAGGCGTVTVQAAFADEYVTSRVITVLDTPALAAMLSETDDDGDAAALAAIEKASRDIAELGELMAAGDLSARAYAAAVAPLERAIAAAEAQVADGARSNVIRLVQPGQLADRWPDLTIDQRRAVIKSVVRWVDVQPVGKGRHGRADRLSIIYRGRLDPANVAKVAATLRTA